MYAHQSANSFNAAAKNAAVEVFTAQNYKVEVSDLYAMNFKATATAEDITGKLLNALKSSAVASKMISLPCSLCRWS